MVDPLVFVKTLVQISFTAAAGPQDVPLVRLSKGKPICLAETSDKLGVALQNFVE